jgi:predicted transcriptional regulator
MNIEGLSLSVDDLKEMIEDRIQHEYGTCPDNVTLRLTLSDETTKKLEKGQDSLDIEIEDGSEEAMLVTWRHEDMKKVKEDGE